MYSCLTSMILVLLFSLVKADQINIVQPSSSSVYHANDKLSIDYNIHSMGMTRIWSTSVTLIQIDNNQTIEGFPTLPYKSSDEKKVNGTWTIPSNISNGTYYLSVAANVTYPCSESHNGKPPYKQCKDTVYQRSTFTILNSV
ncbi:unnamed protein product [Rhizopus stolonifer]